METPTVRLAEERDLPAINRIYNHYVECSTCTFQFDPDSIEATTDWFRHHDELHPVVVAEIEGELVGWGSLSQFRTRRAYEHTVEDSVYVREGLTGRGIGPAILAELVRRARELGHHTMIGVISADQPVSLRVHEKLGFVRVAHLKQVGHKFGEWLDVVMMQLMLGEGNDD